MIGAKTLKVYLLEFLTNKVPTSVVGDILKRSNVRVNLAGP